MKATPPPDAAVDLRALLTAWAAAWGDAGLTDAVAISFSPRLRRSLGRCRPATGRITLRADLRDGPAARLAEVLCHEAAHVAVHRRHGRAARPHGPEWRALVEAAGYEPRRLGVDAPNDRAGAPTRSAAAEPVRALGTPPTAAPPAPRRRYRYEHRCPVCHTVRWARRPVRTWRCAECLDAGLAGERLITRRPADAAP
ncbi:MAG: SprT-like domain-containing protein [Gemmatimonadetes bacterium]|nr:SprT-like domain-containing protein [Gemmatimonadota bacterium]